MDVFDGQTDLCEPIQNLVFREEPSLLLLCLDHATQIASIRVIHHNAQLAPFRLIHLLEPDDVRVVQHFQNLGFPECFSFLLLTHSGDVDLLYHCQTLPNINLIPLPYFVG